MKAAFALALTCCAGACGAFMGRVDFAPGDEPFTEQAVVRGVRATAQQCAQEPQAVWAAVGDDGDCLRYWMAGFPPSGAPVPVALVYMSGDLLEGRRVTSSSYAHQRPSLIQEQVARAAAVRQVPYIFLARPGTFGSSGDHTQRRRARESQIVSSALDALKRRHGVGEWGLAGQSGGGHVVASLLTLRDDIICAVASSGVTSPRARWQRLGLSTDTTGYADSFEPLEHLASARLHPRLRVFVVGDPQDTNTPFDLQKRLVGSIEEAGRKAQVIEAEGSGPQRHSLAVSGVLVGAMCVQGQSDEEIRRRAAAGLKG